MNYTKFLLITAAVVVTTAFSIYIGSITKTIASKSIASVFAFSDSTQTHSDCCKSRSGCGDMKSSGRHDEMMNHENQGNDKSSSEHKQDDESNVKKDDHSGCPGH